MPKTTVDIDHALLESAKEVLGTSTIKDTIQAALTEVVRRRDRARAIDEIAGMVDSGDVDFDLAEEEATAAQVAFSLTATERNLARLLPDYSAFARRLRSPDAIDAMNTHLRNLQRRLDVGDWQVAGSSGGAMVMRSGDSGLAIRVVDGGTLAASQDEAVRLAEQILKDSGAESSEH